MLENIDKSHASSTYLRGGSSDVTALPVSPGRHGAESRPNQPAENWCRQVSPQINTTFELSRPHEVKHIIPPPDHDLALHRLSASLVGFDFDGEKDMDDEEQGQPSGRVSPCTFLAWTEGCRKWKDQVHDQYPTEEDVELRNRLSPSITRHRRHRLQAMPRPAAEYYAVRAPGADYDHAVAQFDAVTGEQLSPFYRVPSHPSVLLSPRGQVRGHYAAQGGKEEEGTDAYRDRDRDQTTSQHDMSSPYSDRTTIRRSSSAVGRRYEVFDGATTIHADGHRHQQVRVGLPPRGSGSAYNARATTAAVRRDQVRITHAVVSPDHEDHHNSLNHGEDMADLIAQQWSRIATLRRREDALDAASVAQHEREAHLDQELTDLRERVDELVTLRRHQHHRQGEEPADNNSHRHAAQGQQDSSIPLPFPTRDNDNDDKHNPQDPLLRHARDAAALLDSMAARVEAKQRDSSDLLLSLDLMERETDVLRERVAFERSRCSYDDSGDGAHYEHEDSTDQTASDIMLNQRIRRAADPDEMETLDNITHGGGGVVDSVEHGWDADLSFEVF